MSASRGTTKASASRLDGKAAPVPALGAIAKAQVSGEDARPVLVAASSNGSGPSSSLSGNGSTNPVPHFGAAEVALSAQAGEEELRAAAVSTLGAGCQETVPHLPLKASAILAMIISPPFLPATQANESDAHYIARAMTGDAPGNGAYPVSMNLGWHGGLHLEAPADDQGQRLPVRAIADGTVNM